MHLQPSPTLPILLQTLNPEGPMAQRHLWAIQTLAWIRGQSPDNTPQDAINRLEELIAYIQAAPETAQKLSQWWQKFIQTVDPTMLLADYGFAPRSAFLNELEQRLRHKLLPATPETINLADLFELFFRPDDSKWLNKIPDASLERLMAILNIQQQANTADQWHSELLDALMYSVSQIQSTGFSPEIRIRMDDSARHSHCFTEIALALDHLEELWGTHPIDSEPFQQMVTRFRNALDNCRQAVNTVYAHLGENGISVGIVFQLRQLRTRVLRVRRLLDALISPTPARAAVQLLAYYAEIYRQRTSIRALISSNSSLLAARVTERSAETGEHYITRTKREYAHMLAKAAGGGAVIAVTTVVKFLLGALGLSIFWGGFWAGMNYAISFLLVHLLHFTVATKQPAMTAPALATKLKIVQQHHENKALEHAEEEFAEEAACLIRSQIAGILGNLMLVFPCIVVMDMVFMYFSQHHMLTQEYALQTLQELSPLGWMPVYAIFTGCLLFASSIIAGWAENWFVLNRLDSAIRWNPRITSRLGAERADRWATWLRNNFSPLISNISLGLMLGIIPAIALFFGLGLEVRHVTLSTGQLAAAFMALEPQTALHHSAFWWAVAGIPVIGACNLLTSFYLAFRVAVRAQSIAESEVRRLRKALFKKLLHAPLSFFIPVKF